MSLQSAELDYDAHCRRTPGITRDDVDTDLIRLELIAASAAETARKAWREYRTLHDARGQGEFELADVARQITDVLAASFGLSREAAAVLDEMAKGQFA